MDKESRARDIVGGLSDPLNSYRVQSELIALGKAAVRPLAEFLLFGGPANEHEPRCLAADALGTIGGVDALEGLVTALLAPFATKDPVKALAEEAVRNCICHALQGHRSERITYSLLTALERFHLVGAAEALSEHGEKAAIPLLIELLEDSFKRWRISDALLKFGKSATEELIKTTQKKEMKEDFEILPSVERRAEAAKLLGLIGDEKGDKQVVSRLIDLLDDEQELVRFEASLALLALMEEQAPEEAFEIIRSSLNSMNLERRLRAEEALCSMSISTGRFR